MIRVIHRITGDYATENTAERLQMEQQVTPGGMKTVGRNLARMSSWLMWREEDLYLIMGGAHPIFDTSDTGGLSYCKLLLMSVILQKKRLLLRLRRIHGGGQTLLRYLLLLSC